MKKLILLCVLIGQLAVGQVSNAYNFSITNGTYTPLINKTVFQSGSQLNTDDVSGAITLPFPFSMYGNAVTKVFVSDNGYITFEAAQTSVSLYSPISSSAGTFGKCKAVISGAGNQIIASQSGSPEISYGSNTSGDFVVQYQDVSLQTSPLTRLTFQIILKSNGTTVQIMWGPNCTGQTINARGSQIGLRGPQTPRTMIQNGVVVEYATPVTEVYNNLSLSNGDWNKFEPNQNLSGGVVLGKSSSSEVTTRLAAGLQMVMANSGTIYQWTSTNTNKRSK